MIIIKEKSFEEAIEELEKIVKDLENGELSLDESISKFQKGIEISSYCNNIIEEAEKKIVLITQKDKIIKEEEFDQ